MKIETRLQAGDIWTAVREDYDVGDPIGVGRSEAAATADLMDQLDEKGRELTDALVEDAHARRLQKREE